jgi:hypothetical protein
MLRYLLALLLMFARVAGQSLPCPANSLISLQVNGSYCLTASSSGTATGSPCAPSNAQQAFVKVPTAAECPFPHCSLPQWKTEEILAAGLAERGISVGRALMATRIETADDGVMVDCVDLGGATAGNEAVVLH